MKPSFILGALTGYVLGARAGRERYEDIVAIARRVAGSQTIQATAGVLEAQLAELAGRTRGKVAERIPLLKTVATSSARTQRSGAASARPGTSAVNGTNGHHAER
jgi:hypothetical protein